MRAGEYSVEPGTTPRLLLRLFVSGGRLAIERRIGVRTAATHDAGGQYLAHRLLAGGGLQPDVEESRAGDLDRLTDIGSTIPGEHALMPTQILMPALSPTMEEGKLAKWLIKEGDAVRRTGRVASVPVGEALLDEPAGRGLAVVEVDFDGPPPIAPAGQGRSEVGHRTSLADSVARANSSPMPMRSTMV